MHTATDNLEDLFEKIRNLPEDRKIAAKVALAELADDGEYILSDIELAILEPALARAKGGEFADEAEVDELLNKPWS